MDSPVYQTAANEYEQVMQYIEPEAAGVAAQTAPGEWAVQSRTTRSSSTVPTTATRHRGQPVAEPRLLRVPRNRQPVLEPGPARSRPDLDGPDLGQAPDAGQEWLELFSQPSDYAQVVKATGSLSTESSVTTPSLKWTGWLSTQ